MGSEIYGKVGMGGGARVHSMGRGMDEIEFSDDEQALLQEPIYNGSQRSYMEQKGWDVFRVLPPEQDSSSEVSKKWLGITVKILKILAYIFTFLVVLVCGVVTKGTTFFMTSQLSLGRKLDYCNHELGRQYEYVATISTEERVAWTWCLFFAFLVPEMGTLIRSGRICIFKSHRKSSLSDFLVVWVFESMYIVGLALLIFVVLPELDVVKGAMLTNCMAFIPGVFGMLSRHQKESRRYLKVFIDILAIICQATGFFVWPMVETQKGNSTAWVIPISIFLISAGWWENYVDRRSPLAPMRSLGKIKDRLKKTRYFVYSFISMWKMALFFSCMLLFLHLNGTPIGPLFSSFRDGFAIHKYNVTRVLNQNPDTFPDIAGLEKLEEIIQLDSWYHVHIHVLMIQIFSAYLAYIFGKFACKICIQGFSFAFPVNLTDRKSVV